MSWFSRFRKCKAPRKCNGDSSGDEMPDVAMQRREGIVTFDLDGFSPESHIELTKEIVRRSGFPLFDGSVTNGYSKTFAGGTGICPRCKSPTRQYTANFIYATDKASRVMLAPAGFFCKGCPTVIVDERIVTTGMKAGYRFRRVVGIDYFEKKDPDYFVTWNGEKPTYVLDENEQILDMLLQSEMRESGYRMQARPRDAAKKAKTKRKQAEKSRRINRKRK